MTQRERQKIARFRRTVRSFYKRHKRTFPWRETRDPYAILVSEVMLQQTQTSRVVEKYRSFLKRFPNVRALSAAQTGEVLAVWQGLGYNRRALALKATAQDIVSAHGGIVPRDLEELDSLPGVGKATAASIAAFAYDLPVVFIETNIRRAFIHGFFPNASRVSVSDEELFPYIEAALDRRHPREWYYALMDYGAALPKIVANPNRRSAHYKRQSAFRGSNREIRGAIVRYLSGREKARLPALKAALPFDPSRISANVEALAAEGFFSLRDSVIIND